MPESNSKILPQFASDEEFVDFFESHDMGDYLNQMPEVDFEIDIKRDRYLVSVDSSLMDQLLETAKSQQVSVELLVDAWLKEKLLRTGWENTGFVDDLNLLQIAFQACDKNFSDRVIYGFYKGSFSGFLKGF